MKNFKKLIVWQKGLELSTLVYKFSMILPPEERFGITSQMRRSAVSITSNIAEGSGKGTDNHFKKFLEDALGSAFELESQLLTTERIYEYVKVEINTIFPLLDEVQKMLISLIEKLKSD